MNENIKEIARQAGIDYERRPEIARAPVWIGCDEELERFAELIVQECINACGSDFGTKLIKQHFGVEP